MEILIIFILILLNGIFAMSELALVSSRKYKLENSKNKGNSGAKKALELSENPTRFLSTVQIGITLIGILLGVYSGEKLTSDTVELVERVGFLKPYADSISTILIVVVITYVSIVLGELLPKRLGMTFPEPIISILAKPMHWLSVITSPFVWLLTQSNNLLLKILGIKNSSDSSVSEEEIKAIVKESAAGGEIEEIEHDIVERVFELGDRTVKSLYTHRSEIVYFDVTDTWEDVLRKVKEEKHSAYPLVLDHDLDEIQGIVLLKDLFSQVRSDDKFDILDFKKNTFFITDNTNGYKILELFKKEKVHYAMVIDEYGSTIGIVTMDDLMDALVGDASEYGQEEYQIVQRNDGSWLVDGQYPLIDFRKEFELNIEDTLIERYSTVAGLMIHQIGSNPVVGNIIRINEYKLEIIDKDGQRIDKILVTKD